MPFGFRKSAQQFSFYEQKAVSRPNRKLIFSNDIFYKSLSLNLTICRSNFENPSNSSHVVSQKPVFEGHFRFSWPNRKQISKTKGGVPYSALNSNYWRLNFENPSIGSRVMWIQQSNNLFYIIIWFRLSVCMYVCLYVCLYVIMLNPHNSTTNGRIFKI